MAHILIDFENVNELGLQGIEELNERDHFILFYNNQCSTISQRNLDFIKNSKCEFQSIKLAVNRPEALDMYIATFCGQLLTEGVEEVVIVSKDKGFNSIKDYVSITSSKMKIVIAENIQEALIQLSFPEDKDRRKRLLYNMQKKSIEEECTKIKNNQQRKNQILKRLADENLADLVESVYEFYESVHKEGKREIYLKAIHTFGRKNGLVIYGILKEYGDELICCRCWNN